jgi:hypothetical protein
MSRIEATNFAQVVCKCPHGHRLGTIIAKWDLTRPDYWASMSWHTRQLNDNNTQSTGDSLAIGEKVKATCEACAKQARYGTDYQASWKSVAAKLAEARDTRAEHTTLVFG